MIIETQGRYSFVVLGGGVEIEVLDEDVWYKGAGTPIRIGSYHNREEAQEVMRLIEQAYAKREAIFWMPDSVELKK